MAPIPHPERRSGSASILPSCIGLVVALAFLAGCGGGEPATDGAEGAAADVTRSERTTATAAAGPAGPAFQDPEVARLYQEMMTAMAPDGGRERLRYLQFAFVVDRGGGNVTRRHHRWDVWEGRYRVAATVGDEAMVALFDVADPTGTEEVWLDGQPVTDPAAADSLVQRAHAIFINDSYWLLMPYKWDDPGVTVEHLGTREMEGAPYEVVELTFDAVGLTPRNKYRAWVDPDTHVMAYWQHYTDASDPEPRFTMAWTDWKRHGPILLSPTRVDLDGNLALSFEELEAATSVPEGVFQGPTG